MLGEQAGQPDVTRQHFTLLFSDLCQYTRLNEWVDPELVREINHHIKESADVILREHTGLLNQDYGDGVMAIFGFPNPQEDDARHAVEAALQLHREIPKLKVVKRLLPPDFGVALHSGIHSGLVVVGQGDPIQGRYELTGDTVNVTMRLCETAGRDEIYVSEATLKGVAEFFVTNPLGPLTLKGRHQQIRTFAVTGRSNVATRYQARVRRGLTGFIGRELQMQYLKERMNRALGGDTAVVGIVGDAGIGKTRLIEEFLRRIQPQGYSIHRGYNESYGAVAPLQPFRQIAREFSGAAQVRADGLTYLLSGLSGERSDERDPAESVAGGLAEIFAELAAQTPVVVFIDDWQWADDASRQVLTMLSEALRGCRVLLLVASRELEPSDPSLRESNSIRLPPFDHEETGRAIKALLPGWFDLGVAEQIHEQSGGNPFFVEELCKSLEGWTPNAYTGSANGLQPVPDWLYGLIRTRVERLPLEQARLARMAAVIGNVVPRWLLVHLSEEESEDQLAELAASDLIYSAGEDADRLRFKHGITREVVYQSIGLEERRQCHRRIARALEQSGAQTGLGDLYEVLAYHYAGAADPSRAAHFAELAGNKAMASSSLDRARRQYRAALVALDALMTLEEDVAQNEVYQKWCDVMARWALAIVYSPSRDQLGLLQRAVERAEKRGNEDGLAWAEYWSGFVLYSLGDLRESVAHLERAASNARKSGNHKLVTQIVAALGHSHAAAGAYDSALTRLDEAISVKRRRSSTVSLSVTLAYSTMCRATVLADQGNFADAQLLARESVEAVEGSNHEVEGSILALRCAICIWQGDWQQAMRDARKAHAVAQRVGGPYVFAMARALEGYARWKSDLDTDGIEMLRQATAWLESWDMRLYISLPYGWLADALATAGLDAEARRFAGRALWRSRKLDRLGECVAYRALAQLARRNSRSDLAEAYYGRAIAAAERRGSARDEAITLAELGELRDDGDLVKQARARLSAMDVSPNLYQDTTAARPQPLTIVSGDR